MATSQYTDKSQLVGALKETYSKEIKDLRLKVAVLQELVPFKDASLVSNNYHQPVVLTHSHGWFYDVSGGSRNMPDSPTAMQTQDAVVPAFEITERVRIPFGTLASLNAGNAASFFNTSTLKMLSYQKAEIRNVEWSALYGQQAVASITACTAPSGGQVTVTFDPTTISEGFLAGLENAPVDVYSAQTSGTIANSVQALTLVSVDLDAGTAVLASSAGADLTAVQGGSFPTFLYRRSTYGFEMPGLIAQAANTGTLFGINYASYSLFRTVKQTNVGQPSMKKILDGVAKAQARGCESDLKLMASPKGFNALMQDMSSLRRIGSGDYSTKKLQNGAQAVEFWSQSGSIEVISHPFMKNGDMLAVSPANLARFGATDITDTLGGEDLAVMQGSNNAIEFRIFTNQAVLNFAPAQSVLFTGCTYA